MVQDSGPGSRALIPASIHSGSTSLVVGLCQSAVWQLATKSGSELSWFSRIRQLLEMYELPLPSHLLENVPTRTKCKKMVNKVINSVVEVQWQEEISSRSTLNYMNPESLRVGRAHHVWSSVRNSIHDSRRAQAPFGVLPMVPLVILPMVPLVAMIPLAYHWHQLYHWESQWYHWHYHWYKWYYHWYHW